MAVLWDSLATSGARGLCVRFRPKQKDGCPWRGHEKARRVQWPGGLGKGRNEAGSSGACERGINLRYQGWMPTSLIGGALCLSVRDADVCWLETGGMLNVAARLSEVGGTAGGRGLPQIADRRDPGRRQASKKFSSEKKYQMTESLVTLVRLNESAHIGQIAIFSRAKITDRILAGLKSWL